MSQSVAEAAGAPATEPSQPTATLGTAGGKLPVAPLAPTPAAVGPAKVAAFLAMGLLYFFAFFQRVAVPGTMFDPIQADLAIPAAAVTGLGAIYLSVYAAAQFFVGLIADRFGGARTMLLGALLLAGGSILFPLSPTLALLNLSRGLVGVGSAFVFICYVKETGALFGPRYFAYLTGPIMFMGLLGGLAGTLPTEWAVAAVGWRKTMLGAGVLTALTLAATALLLRPVREHTSRGRPFSRRLLAEVLRTRGYPAGVAAGALTFCAYMIIQAILGKKFLQDFAGLSSSAAAGFTFAMMGLSMAVTFIAGFLPLLIGRRRIPLLLATRLGALLGVLLLLAGVRGHGGPGLFLAGYLLLGLANGLAPVSLAWVSEVVRPASLGLAVAFSNTLVYVTVAIATGLTGLVLDRFEAQATRVGESIIYPPAAYTAVFLGLAGLTLAASLLTLRQGETRGRPRWQA